jgi:hypothetical protein
MYKHVHKVRNDLYRQWSDVYFITDLTVFKDWSQFLFSSCGLRKGVYNLIEVISNEPNKYFRSILIN